MVKDLGMAYLRCIIHISHANSIFQRLQPSLDRLWFSLAIPGIIIIILDNGIDWIPGVPRGILDSLPVDEKCSVRSQLFIQVCEQLLETCIYPLKRTSIQIIVYIPIYVCVCDCIPARNLILRPLGSSSVLHIYIFFFVDVSPIICFDEEHLLSLGQVL